MYYYSQKRMIYENARLDTKYWIASYTKSTSFGNDTFMLRYENILLEGKCNSGFFKKKFNFNTYDLYWVKNEVPDYTFEQFKKDLEDLDNPKYIIIYAERPTDWSKYGVPSNTNDEREKMANEMNDPSM